jgi:LysM repeat protein
VIGILGLLIWGSLSSGLFRFADWRHPSGDTGPIVMTVTGNRTPSVVPKLVQRTSTPASLPPSPSPTRRIATSTPTVIPFHALETPIGREHSFIIHRILDGESLDSISENYGTTPEALQLVNYDLQIPLLTGYLIIIPVDQTDVIGLPVFEAYMVKENVTVESLAQQLNIDPAALKLYNNLENGQVLIANEWVLVPHLGTPTP